MLTSRRLVLASAALILGLSACGSASTTTSGPTATSTANTVRADGPQVIAFGSATNGGGGWSSATGAATESADKMMAFRNITYVFDGGLPELSATGGSWQFTAGFTPDRARVASMAAALGVEGALRDLPTDQGGGWMVGPEDYSAASLTVSADGLGSWWFNPSPELSVSTVSACEIAPIETVPTDAAQTDATGTDAVATTALQQCPEPVPPVGVPGEGEAMDKAKAVFTDLGYDPAAYEYEFYGDDWSANVTAYLQLDGRRSPISLSIGFGGDGAIMWSSGSLATPVRGDDYPLVGVQAGVERLNDQAHWWMGIGTGVAESTMRSESVDSFGDAVPGAGTDTAIAPVEPVAEPPVDATATVDPMPVDIPVECRPAAVCFPVDTTPVIVHLTTVHPDLTMIWDADNTVWLLPAYTFGDADGGIYTVIAVTDEFLDIPAATNTVPETPPTDVVVGTDVPVPDTVVTPGIDPTETTASSDGPSTVDQDKVAAVLVGVTETDATIAAEANGWTLRVVEIDGESLAVTMDYMPTRVNVGVADGVVVAVVSIG